MDKQEIITHLQGRREQLIALIAHLEGRGKTHPQYNQLQICRNELQTVNSQLKKLNS